MTVLSLDLVRCDGCGKTAPATADWVSLDAQKSLGDSRTQSIEFDACSSQCLSDAFELWILTNKFDEDDRGNDDDT